MCVLELAFLSEPLTRITQPDYHITASSPFGQAIIVPPTSHHLRSSVTAADVQDAIRDVQYKTSLAWRHMG